MWMRKNDSPDDIVTRKELEQALKYIPSYLPRR
jgi:hypothetical protein